MPYEIIGGGFRPVSWSISFKDRNERGVGIDTPAECKIEVIGTAKPYGRIPRLDSVRSSPGILGIKMYRTLKPLGPKLSIYCGISGQQARNHKRGFKVLTERAPRCFYWLDRQLVTLDAES